MTPQQTQSDDYLVLEKDAAVADLKPEAAESSLRELA